METTLFICKIIGPVLLLRGVSFLIDRPHFEKMLESLPSEVPTISFSLVPIAILMSCIAIAVTHRDRSSPAAWLIHAIAYGGMLKTSLLILFPRLVVQKAQMIGKAGFFHVAWVVCVVFGLYFSWFGYFAGVRPAAP